MCRSRFQKILILICIFTGGGASARPFVCPMPSAFGSRQAPVLRLLGEAEELTPLLAGIYGEESRQVLSQHIYPYTAVGRLLYTVDLLDENGVVLGSQESWCTASLVSGCHISTARHCVIDAPRTTDQVDPCFRPGRFRRRNFRFQDSQGTIHATNATMAGADTRDSEDFAFFRLATNRVNREVGFLPIRIFSGNSVDRLNVAAPGFSADQFFGQLLTEDIVGELLFSHRPEVANLRLDSYSGSSGGPIIAPDELGRPHLIGIQIQAVSRFRGSGCDRAPENMPLPAEETVRLGKAVTTASFYQHWLEFQQANACGLSR